MPSWILNCPNCESQFTHSIVKDDGMVGYLSGLPLKPELPLAGIELECPSCRHKATYNRTDLKYQA